MQVEKAKKLSDHLGLQQQIIKHMTFAEITNPEETDVQPQKVSLIGFRRMEAMMAN